MSMETALTSAGLEAKSPSDGAKRKDSEMITNPVVIAVFGFIVRCPWLVIALIACGGVTAGLIQKPYDRLKNAPMNLKPVENRLTSVTNALRDDFEVQGTSSAADALIMWCDGTCDLTKEKTFTEALDKLNSKLAHLQKNDASCKNITWNSYSPDMSGLEKKQFLAKDRSASVLLLHRNEKLEVGQISDCFIEVQGFVSDLDKKYNSLHMAFGTPIATAMTSLDREADNVMHHVCISVPILSLLFYFYVGSFLKVLTALISLGCTQMWVKAIIVLMKQSWSNFNLTASDTSILFVQLALALDYAVIFWGRFRQERLNRPSSHEYVDCVLTTLKTSGLVIIVSVVVLEVGFTGMLFYPNLNSSGNLAITYMLMLSCLSVGVHSLVVPAAMGAGFPSLFDEGSSTWCPSLFGSSQPDDRDSRVPQEPGPTMGEQFFKKYAKVATRPPCVYVLPVLAYMLFVPFLFQLASYRPWYDILETLMDKTLKEYEAYKVFSDRFVSSRAEPCMLLIKAERLHHSALQADATVERHGFYHAVGRLDAIALDLEGASDAGGAAGSAQESLGLATLAQAHIRRLGGATRATFASKAIARAMSSLRSSQLPALPSAFQTEDPVAFSPEYRNLTCSTVESILHGSKGTSYEIRSMDVQSMWWNAEEGRCRNFPNVLQGTLSKSGREEMIQIYPSFASLGRESQELTEFIWNKIEPTTAAAFTSRNKNYRYTTQFYSAVAVMMLSDEDLTHRAPWVICGTVICICIVVGLFFRSAGVAVKVLLSVVVPILCNYGLFVAMWQNGWFQWAGVTPTGGVISMMMFTTFGFLLGLAIDYDIVLFARVYERRMEGYDNLSAVQMGLVETGPMVTLAGTLMTSSFLVMCFDQLAVVRQLAGLYFLGVALDTYLVRTCIAPTMLVLAGRMNYWPQKMPPETKTYDADS